jgi:sigma-B regulation protein RsbU (phosphoserine phosphatase)
MGLRLKSALAVGASALLVMLLAALIGSSVLQTVQENLSHAFARNATQFNKQRLLTPITRELVLSQRLADSELLRQWLKNPDDVKARSQFFREAEGYRKSFSDGSYFVADIARNSYYFNNNKTEFSDQPREILNPDRTADSWFFNSIKNTETYNINVDFNSQINQTKVWINVLHRENGKKSAIAGTGLDLTAFIEKFVSSQEKGVTPIILGENGAIQAHPNSKLIALNSGSGEEAQSTIYKLIKPTDQPVVRELLQKASVNPETVQLVNVNLSGKESLLAISYVRELKWYVVTAVDLNVAQFLDTQNLLLPLGLGLATLILLLVLVSVAVNRVVLTPLLNLTNCVRQVEAGNYNNVEWPRASDDEIGDLSRAFVNMTTQIRAHTDELETLVDQRTRELREAGEQIRNSIEYASLIQTAILPKRELAETFGDDHSILWKPRDVVGGDIYAFRSGENGCLIGLIDCAGHSVPGAFMTMIAHGALNSAIDEIGIEDPARILELVDQKIRDTLGETGQVAGVATNMDAALVFVDARRDELLFSGSHLNLFCSSGENVIQIKGSKTPLGGKKIPKLKNEIHTIKPDETFYLSSDGFLDQSGGEKGFSFGTTRFSEMILRYRDRPLDAQVEAFAQELSFYRGALLQRDDISLVAFSKPKSNLQTTSTHDSHLETSHGSL